MEGKMKVIISYLFLVLFVVSCCDCLNESEPSETKPYCSPREATVTEFDPSITQTVLTDVNGNDSIVYYPVASYSIHGYEFPNSKASAGNLKIDNNRYKAETGINRIPIAKTPLPNALFNIYPLYLAVLTPLPENDAIQGDFIVADVDLITNPADPVARIRFWGKVGFVTTDPLTESSRDFCDYYEQSFDITSFSGTQYGEGMTDGFGNQRSFNGSITTTTALIDASGNILVEDISNPTNRSVGGVYIGMNEIQLLGALSSLFGSSLNNLFTTPEYIKMINEVNSTKIVDVEVHIGDYLTYMARNGQKFLIQVLNIDERDVNAVKKRVSFIFTEV